jgi:hypothetical protein
MPLDRDKLRHVVNHMPLDVFESATRITITLHERHLEVEYFPPYKFDPSSIGAVASQTFPTIYSRPEELSMTPEQFAAHVAKTKASPSKNPR